MPPGAIEFDDRNEAALAEIRGQGRHHEITNLDPAEAPDILPRFVHYPQCDNEVGDTHPRGTHPRARDAQ